jgi:hypothetical protein
MVTPVQPTLAILILGGLSAKAVPQVRIAVMNTVIMIRLVLRNIKSPYIC